MHLFKDAWCAIRRRCTVVFPGDDFTQYLKEQRDAAEESAAELVRRRQAIDDQFFPPRGEKRDNHVSD